MSSFCTAKATHIFSAKKIQHICVSLDVNFNELLTNDVVSFEQLGPENYFYLFLHKSMCSGTHCKDLNEVLIKISHNIPIGLDKGGYPVNIFLIFP